MSSTPSIPPLTEPPESFTAMSVGDVDAIGSHCQFAFCHQLDFLPFRCESCHGKFCLDHRTETSHACPNAGAYARQRAARLHATSSTATSTATATAGKPHILTHESQCSHPACKTLVNTPLVPGIDCATCRRTYCLKHRMKEEHECAKLTPLGVGQEQRRDNGLGDALSKLRAWGAAKKAASATPSTSGTKATGTSAKGAAAAAEKQGAQTQTQTQSTLHRIVSPFTSSKPSSTSTASTITALNTLKKTAKGDAKIPAASRIYVRIEAVAEGREGSAGTALKVPRAEAFYNAEWVVGRVLDEAAKTLAIRNVNNRVDREEDRLRVFWVEGGRLLAFGEKLGNKGANVKNTDTLVLLRGVGAAEV